MQKAYYAVITADVRYDKELSPNAKLLYGEITALTNHRGYCWANNGYFAKLYGVSSRTVSRWISQLEERGYIEIETIYQEGTKIIKERRIYISNYHVDENDVNEKDGDPIDKNVHTYRQNCHDPMDKNVRGYRQNCHDPMDKNVQDNNTVFNITTNTTMNTTDNIELQKNCNDDGLKFPESSQEIQLARFMIDEMLRIKPDSRVPNRDVKSLQNWGQYIDYMIRLDGRKPREIAELFRWAQEDSFWVANIRSPRKLREKWDTLELQRSRDRPKTNKNISRLEEMYKQALAEEGEA